MAIIEVKQKNNTVYRVIITYKDKYGITKKYTKSGFTSIRKARNHERVVLQEIKNNTLIEDNKTLNEVFDEYIINDPHTAQSTKNVRKQYYNKHIRNRFGDADIKLIDYELLLNFFNELAAVYTKATNENIYKVLNATFRYAYNLHYINRMPYSRIKINGKSSNRNTSKIVSKEDLENIINYLDTCSSRNKIRFKSYKIAILFGYYTGCRLGEILALERRDIDFTNMNITINKSLYQEGQDVVIKDTKTESSNSVIPLPRILADILSQWFTTNESTLVVCDNDLSYLKPALIKGFLLNYSRKHNINFHFHMLRHTYATKLWENKVDIKVAQTLLRHSDYSTTAEIYTHLDNTNRNSIVDDIFN